MSEALDLVDIFEEAAEPAEATPPPNLRVIQGGLKDALDTLVITDEMRRSLPPGAIGRLAGAALDATPQEVASADLRRQMGRAGVSSGSGRRLVRDPAAFHLPYAAGVRY